MFTDNWWYLSYRCKVSLKSLWTILLTIARTTQLGPQALLNSGSSIANFCLRLKLHFPLSFLTGNPQHWFNKTWDNTLTNKSSYFIHDSDVFPMQWSAYYLLAWFHVKDEYISVYTSIPSQPSVITIIYFHYTIKISIFSPENLSLFTRHKLTSMYTW